MDAKTVNKHMTDLFETTMLECMFERQFKKSHQHATVADLESLKHR